MKHAGVFTLGCEITDPAGRASIEVLAEQELQVEMVERQVYTGETVQVRTLGSNEDFDEAGEYGEDYGGGEYDDAALHDGLIEHEVRRIVERMKGLDRLNRPNKTHFMVEIALAFMQLASTKDTGRLFSMLPYELLAIPIFMPQKLCCFFILGLDTYLQVAITT